MSFETPGPVETDLIAVISPIEDIIADAKVGRMFILVDHEGIMVLTDECRSE